MKVPAMPVRDIDHGRHAQLPILWIYRFHVCHFTLLATHDLNVPLPRLQCPYLGR